MTISQQITENFFWVDVIAFGLLALLILFLLISNHFYLQFFTSLFLINVGVFTLVLPFIMPDVLELRRVLISKIDDDQIVLKLIVYSFAENPLFVEIVIFISLFLLCWILFTIIYLVGIKFKYPTNFSIFSLKQNVWKVLYLPFFFLGIGFLLFPVVPIVGEKIAKTSTFLKIIYFTKLNKLIERKNYLPKAEILYDSLEKVANKDLPSQERQKALLHTIFVVSPLLDNQEVSERLKNKLRAKFTDKEKEIFEQLTSPEYNEQEKSEKTDQFLIELKKRPDIEEGLENIINDPLVTDRAKDIMETTKFEEGSLVGLIEEFVDRFNKNDIDGIVLDNLKKPEEQ